MLLRDGSSYDEDLKPATIMRNVYGVFPSFAMLAGMQLDLFTPLKDDPMSAKDLAGVLEVREDKLTPLLYLLVVAGLLEVESKKFSNTPEAAKFLIRGCPSYIGGLSGFYNMLWQVSLNTAESIRTGKPNAKIDYHDLPEGELLAFFQKQIHSSRNGGKEIAGKLDFSKFKRLLDAGGGTGGVSIAICTKYPHLKATVVDLPKVVRLAAGFIAEAGMSDRISVSITDLCSSPPEGQYDVAILRAVIQTLSQEEALAVLKSISQSMLPGGRIFIFGSVLDDSRLGPPASLANGFANLNVYDHGKAYTETEYREMLINAEFTNVVIEHDALVDGMAMVTGEKKSATITVGAQWQRNNLSLDEDLKPATIMHNVYSVLPSFAMLAGMQLDLFTPLKDGPMSAKDLAGA
ncbi:MAG: acetylserotonin O-methyltransferase, partial [Firmicutes bacterium]|nr:acetylserotonin O-methyltransferase [Bacillota bacterium]